MALIFNCLIFSSFFGPASSPKTTTEVLLEIDLVTLAPYLFAKASDAPRSKVGRTPVKTIVRPNKQFGFPSGKLPISETISSGSAFEFALLKSNLAFSFT
ncbi:hypothetical protein AWRI1631_153660 [Saccharomyces cerevisiae AWRI1631]|uniref:Uncharacterized protein n=1 Tax=Saccharomyces cerevisiae (strain AWRI1631) TaxID=545124 RepID=B5VS98_YEAS6|nr:hypothetical protein AWRI1631_153660 [Saccharomyces cerevisiae AWRI1631]